MKQPLIIGLTLICSAVFGQNLVPNPSFEEFGNCPYLTGHFDGFVDDWTRWRQNPDYMNICDTIGWIGLPKNCWGYQNTVSGNAYAGIHTFGGFSPNGSYREYIGAQLLEPMEIGTKYYASVYVSATILNTICNNTDNQHVNNNLGLFFSTVEYHGQSNPLPIPNFAHVNEPNIISDTVNWTFVGGSFIADSAYKYVVVGNFFDDSYIDILNIYPEGEGPGGYYYIDKVCVSTDSTTCQAPLGVSQPALDSHLSIYPNPTLTDLIIKSTNRVGRIEVFDTYGRVVLQIDGEKKKQIEISVDGLTAGIYTVAVVDDTGQRLTRRILKK